MKWIGLLREILREDDSENFNWKKTLGYTAAYIPPTCFFLLSAICFAVPNIMSITNVPSPDAVWKQKFLLRHVMKIRYIFSYYMPRFMRIRTTCCFYFVKLLNLPFSFDVNLHFLCLTILYSICFRTFPLSIMMSESLCSPFY